MKAKLQSTRRATGRTDPELVVEKNGVRLLPAGTVIDHPDVYQLCMSGIATPEDQECLDELERRGWGKDVFAAKFAAASAQQGKWEQGIRDAMDPGAINNQSEVDDDGAGNSDE